MNVINLILIVIAMEAAVELWRKAAPLQPIREKLVAITPFLYSERQQTHLLQCPYCLSVYAGIVGGFLYFWMAIACVKFFIIAMALHRMSNLLHLGISFLRDKQIDIRIERGRRRMSDE